MDSYGGTDSENWMEAVDHLAVNYQLELLSLISADHGHAVHLPPYLMTAVPTSNRGLPSYNE